MTTPKYVTIVFECDIGKFEGDIFHIENPFGKMEILATGNQIAFLESEVEDADIKMKCLEEDNKRLRQTVTWRPINADARDGKDILALCDGDGTQAIPLVLCFDDRAEEPDWPWMTLDGHNYHKDLPKWWMPIPSDPSKEVCLFLQDKEGV